MSRPIPTRRLALVALALAVVLAVFPWPGGDEIWPELWIGGLVVLAMIGVADGALAPSPRRFGVERVHPAAVTMDARAAMRWEVSGQFGREYTVQLADDLAPSLGAETRRVSVVVPADGVGISTTWFSPRRRGRFEPSAVVLRTTGPLGLIQRQATHQVPTRLRVLPPFRSKAEAELGLRQARIQQVGLRSARNRGGGTEFDHLREMTPDDETRRIDWAATARSQRPVVRTYRSEENQTVICLVDSGRVMAGRIDAVPRFDYAIDAAMLLAELATGLGDRMGLVAFDRTVHTRIEPSNRRSQRALVSERLFDIQPALAESDYRSMVSYVAARHRRRQFMVLVTDLSEEVLESHVFPALPILTRTHLVAIAAVSDPAVAMLTQAGRADAEGGFLRASAIETQARRQRLAAGLRSKGVLVIDEPPARFGAAIAALYLETKAVGRL